MSNPATYFHTRHNLPAKMVDLRLKLQQLEQELGIKLYLTVGELVANSQKEEPSHV